MSEPIIDVPTDSEIKIKINYTQKYALIWIFISLLLVFITYFYPRSKENLFVAIFFLGLLGAIAYKFYSIDREFPVASAATLIQGSSIFLMVVKIGSPLLEINSEANLTTGDMLGLISPVGAALMLMAWGIAVAVGLNYITDTATEPAININIEKINFGDLERDLAKTTDNIKILNERIIAMGKALDATSERIIAVGEKSESLDKALGQVSSIIRDLDTFFVNKPRDP